MWACKIQIYMSVIVRRSSLFENFYKIVKGQQWNTEFIHDLFVLFIITHLKNRSTKKAILFFFVYTVCPIWRSEGGNPLPHKHNSPLQISRDLPGQHGQLFRLLLSRCWSSPAIGALLLPGALLLLRPLSR